VGDILRVGGERSSLLVERDRRRETRLTGLVRSHLDLTVVANGDSRPTRVAADNGADICATALFGVAQRDTIVGTDPAVPPAVTIGPVGFDATDG